MSIAEIVALPTAAKKERGSMKCPKCGETQRASCDCGVKWIWESPRKRAEKAVAANPDKSDYAIGEDIGVSHQTVARARAESTSPHGLVEKRVGRDGKRRKGKKTKKSKPKPMVATLPAVRRRVNELLNMLSRHVDGDCRRISEFWIAHRDLESEGVETLLRFLQLNANKLMALAQEIDGRGEPVEE